MRQCFFFFNDTATTEIYTLSLHDALPICIGRFLCRSAGGGLDGGHSLRAGRVHCDDEEVDQQDGRIRDRKSTRLNSSHSQISYAVFCLKKKTNASKYIHQNNRH